MRWGEAWSEGSGRGAHLHHLLELVLGDLLDGTRRAGGDIARAGAGRARGTEGRGGRDARASGERREGAPDRDGGGMASGDGEHRAREREWCRRATEGLEGLSGVVRTRRTALDGRSRGTAARVSMPLRIRTVRNTQTPNRRFSSPSLGGRPTRVQNFLTAFAVASRPLSPRAPRTPRGPVSHERQLADRSFSRPFHPTCLRRVDRGARPHRLSRIFQSSSDFLVSSSPFSIPRRFPS